MHLGVNARTFCIDQPDGATQASMKLASTLAADSGIEVTYFGSNRLPAAFRTNARTTGYPIRSQIYGVCWERTVLPFLARSANIDVLLCPTANAPFFESGDFAIATFIHDVNAQKDMAGRLQRLYRKVTVPRTVSVSDVLLTVSEFSKTEICQQFDVDPEEVSVVYNGIDDVFHDDSPGDPVDLPDRYVLYVGAMNPRKNVDGLVTAFAEFNQRVAEEYHLVLVGPKNKLIYESLDVPADDNVHTPGFLSIEELKYAYRNAALFCFPSFYEGFGLPPLEAMACGTPVVASETTALPEILGDAAELVDPRRTEAIVNGMLAVTEDSEYRSALIERGRARASEFTWHRAADDLKAVLESAV